MHRFLLLLLMTSACSPYLQYRQDEVRAYGFSAPCGQGPVQLTLRLKGARWGEKLAIAGFAPHAVMGRYAVKLDGRPISEGTFATQRPVQVGSYTTIQADQKPQNARCVERPTEMAQPPPETQVLEQPRVWGTEPTTAPPTVTEPPPVLEAPRRETVQLVALGADAFVAEGSRNFTIASFDWPSLDEIGTARVEADAVLEITLWSQEPNDWGGALLQLVHEVAQPSVPDAEYIAFLHKERREAEAEAKARQAKADAEQQARVAHCQAHHDDEGCWGEGGYEAYAKAYWTPRPTTKPSPAPVAEVMDPQPHAPESPPPAAQTEMPPPKPSRDAAWIAGYWQWTGLDWSWLGGWWKVPPQDLVAQATISAPSPPPPPQAEPRQRPPRLDAVWLAGAWYWDGAIWLWYPGQWGLPPQPGLAWQPPTWVTDGRQVRLVPGMWVAAQRLPLP